MPLELRINPLRILTADKKNGADNSAPFLQPSI